MNHSMDIRVYFEDTDSGGVVYHASYLKFGERGRTELLRSMGFENKKLQDDKGILFVVRRIEADYLAPARLDHHLTLKTQVKSLKNTSMIMTQSVYNQGVLVFSMDVTLVCVDTKNFKPARFPDDIKTAFETYL
jgi:acyl-CoA thioester hydrolase